MGKDPDMQPPLLTNLLMEHKAPIEVVCLLCVTNKRKKISPMKISYPEGCRLVYDVQNGHVKSEEPFTCWPV